MTEARAKLNPSRDIELLSFIVSEHTKAFEELRIEQQRTSEKRDIEMKVVWRILRGENGEMIGLIEHVRVLRTKAQELKTLKTILAATVLSFAGALLLAWLSGTFTPSTTKKEGEGIMRHLQELKDQIQQLQQHRAPGPGEGSRDK